MAGLPETAFKPRDPDWERRCRDSFARQQYMSLIGAEIVAVAPGRCAVAVRHEAGTDATARLSAWRRHSRACRYGGRIRRLFADAGGLVAADRGIQDQPVAPAAGDRFVAIANVVRSGRTLTIVETDVSAEIGGETKIVAKMLATLICIENTPDRIAS